jgi:hypothetical protein
MCSIERIFGFMLAVRRLAAKVLGAVRVAELSAHRDRPAFSTRHTYGSGRLEPAQLPGGQQ